MGEFPNYFYQINKGKCCYTKSVGRGRVGGRSE